MELSQILSRCDHTLLAQTATWADIQAICDDGMKYKTASVCIPASFVQQAKQYVGDRLAICTVIGFPNGYATTASKCFMAHDAVCHGADEVDMVINIGWAKEGKWEALTEEIRQIKAHCCGKILKVIIETCLLTDEEKVQACRIARRCGANFVKTSTGFSTGGATVEDVALMKKAAGANVKVKASGGIRDYATAKAMIEAGADRIGASAGVSIVKEEQEAVK